MKTRLERMPYRPRLLEAFLATTHLDPTTFVTPPLRIVSVGELRAASTPGGVSQQSTGAAIAAAQLMSIIGLKSILPEILAALTERPKT